MVYEQDGFFLTKLILKFWYSKKNTKILCLEKLPIRGIKKETVRKIGYNGRFSKVIDGQGIYFARTSIEPEVEGCMVGEQMFCWNNKTGNLVLIDKLGDRYLMKACISQIRSMETKKKLRVIHESPNLQKTLIVAYQYLSKDTEYNTV